MHSIPTLEDKKFKKEILKDEMEEEWYNRVLRDSSVLPDYARYMKLKKEKELEQEEDIGDDEFMEELKSL